MQQDNREDFINAIVKEIDDHTTNRHWKVVNRSMNVNIKITKTIWSFKRKGRPDGSLLKHNERLCVHRGMQQYSANYWNTYDSVFNWDSVRLILTFALLNTILSRSMDFTSVFPQTDTDVENFMELPIDVDVSKGEIRNIFILYLLKQLCGLKQTSKIHF